MAPFVFRSFQVRLFACVAVLLAGFTAHGTYAGTGDAPHYLVIAHSIAFDFDLDVSNNYGAAEPLIADGTLVPGPHARAGSDGTLRPIHDIGMPVLFAPYVRVAKPAAALLAGRLGPRGLERWRLTPSVLYRHFISAAMIVVAGALAIVLFEVFVVLGLTRRAAFWTALLVVLSPPFLVFSILFFTELLSALLVLVLFRKIVIEERTGPSWVWGLAGAATGFLVLIHVRNGVLAIVLAALAVWGLRHRETRAQLAAFVLAFAAMAILRTLVTHHLWGTWMTTPHARAGGWTGLGSVLTIAGGRLAGLLIDQEYGLLPYAPLYVLSTLGFVAIARTRPKLGWSVALIAGAYVISVVFPITNVHGWTGGWSPPARFLVPILPLLAIGVAAGVRTTPRLLLVAIVAAQITIDAYVWQHPKVLWNVGTGQAAVCERLGPAICRVLPSFVKTP